MFDWTLGSFDWQMSLLCQTAIFNIKIMTAQNYGTYILLKLIGYLQKG